MVSEHNTQSNYTLFLAIIAWSIVLLGIMSHCVLWHWVLCHIGFFGVGYYGIENYDFGYYDMQRNYITGNGCLVIANRSPSWQDGSCLQVFFSWIWHLLGIELRNINLVSVEILHGYRLSRQTVWMLTKAHCQQHNKLKAFSSQIYFLNQVF